MNSTHVVSLQIHFQHNLDPTGGYCAGEGSNWLLRGRKTVAESLDWNLLSPPSRFPSFPLVVLGSTPWCFYSAYLLVLVLSGVTADIQSQSAESQAKSQLTGVASQRPAGPDLSSFAVSAANMLSTTGLPTYLPNDSHQRQHGHVHSYPFPTALPTGIPTPSGVQQLVGTHSSSCHSNFRLATFMHFFSVRIVRSQWHAAFFAQWPPGSRGYPVRCDSRSCRAGIDELNEGLLANSVSELLICSKILYS